MTEPLLPDQVLAQARQQPDAIAVRQWSQQYTYRGLLEHAGALAARLRQLGVGPEVPVGICMSRTPASVAAIVGVGLSGGAYLCLDLSHPSGRNRELIADAGLALLVVDRAGREHLAGTVPDRQLLEMPEATVPLAAIPPCPATPDSLFQIFYTSGSTGRPKGVQTTHRNAASFVGPCGSRIGVGPQMRAMAFFSFGFDAATWDLFVPLLAGGSIQLVGDRDRSDPARLQRFAARHRVTWTVIAPAVLALLDPAQLPELAVVQVGGEVVPPELVEPWTAGGWRRMLDVYGPTEATVVSLAMAVSGRWTEPLPIGYPLGDDLAYLLDRRGDPLPDGEVGELYLGGPGIARGYLGRPGLTAQRFRPDPFAAVPGARMYRTGDLARRRPDGAYAYLGRQDGQVQVRGQRVELGEVETVLRSHPAVSQAAVVAVDEHGLDTSLVAFVTPGTAPGQPELRSYAAQRLTAAMLPRFVAQLERLPMAPSGKLDRARLRALAADLVQQSSADGGAGLAGADRLAALWHQVLGGPAPAPADDFFDRGGHSIAAMRLVAAIRREFEVEVSAEDVFAARTLAGLRHRITAAPAISGPPLTAGNPPTLSPSQRRLWFLDRLVPGGTAYNVAFAERLRGPLDPDRLAAALSAVVARQDVLRWRIVEQQGQPVPVCDPPVELELPVVAVTEPELPAAVAKLAGQAFDLATGPLWSAKLFRLGPAEHVLALAFHHAIVDGWSQAPFYADLARAYAGQELPEPPVRYADYASWRGRRDADRAAADRDWWVQRLQGAPAVLDLPRDRPRPAVQTYRGELVSITLPEPVEAGVAGLAREVGATPAMVVLTGLARALGQLTGASELVIGALAADRGQAGVAELVGFFVDIVPLRLPVPAAVDFRTAVRGCRDAYLAAMGHPGVPLDQIVDALGIPRDPSRPPLVQVMFNVYNFAEPRLELPAVAAEPVPVPVPGAPFDLTAYLLRRDGRAVLEFVYNPDLYDRPRMAALATGVEDLLAELVAQPDRPVAQARTRFRTDGVTEVAADRPPPALAADGDPLPATPTERLVAQVWRSVLSRQEVRAIDNFFDVGGTSMAAVAVQAQLVELLGRPIEVVDLFRYPSIRAFAAHLDGAGSHPALDRAARIAAARRQRARRP